MLRLGLLTVATLVISSGPLPAQGIKDPPNYGTATTTRQPSGPTPAGRPTAVQNIPTNMLPPGTAIQRSYKDGKVHTYVR